MSLLQHRGKCTSKKALKRMAGTCSELALLSASENIKTSSLCSPDHNRISRPWCKYPGNWFCMVRPRICNPVIPDAGRAGSGLHFSAVKLGSLEKPTFPCKSRGRKSRFDASFAQDTATPRGSWVPLIFMGLPRKCLKQKKTGEVFSEFGLVCFYFLQCLNVFLSQNPNLPCPLATFVVPLLRRGDFGPCWRG